MLITLKLTDGSQQTLDVDELQTVLGESPLELTFQTVPPRLVIQSPGTDEQWHALVVHPGAANLVTIEARSNARISNARE